MPLDAVPGETFARFRFSHQTGLSFTGVAEDGEVEDYILPIAEAEPDIDIEKTTNGQDADTPTGPIIKVGDVVTWEYVVTNTGNVPLTNVTITDDQGVNVSCPKTTLDVWETMICTATGIAAWGQYANVGTATGTTPAGDVVSDTDKSHYFGEVPRDYGDAPDTYRTLLASDGARHIINPDVFLGLNVDSEPDGQPDAGAQGDDNNGTPDDEDGVVFTSQLTKGMTNTITVSASMPGLLNAWVDFDGSGNWNIL